MPMNDYNFVVRLPTQLRDQVEVLARSEGRDVANMARRIMELAVRERMIANKKTTALECR
jgi:hypothetical protein